MVELLECRYHCLLTTLTEQIYEKLESHYDWEFFGYWLGDESEFGHVYREGFSLFWTLLLDQTLTEEQLDLVESKGRNLESTMGKWLQKWKESHPNSGDAKMPLSCLKYKVFEYIAYQLRQHDLRQLVGNPC
jgi:hypothetical protein